MRLKKLSDTRWSCRYDSIVAVMTTYSALLETLEQTADGTDRMKAIEVTGILDGLKSYDFVVSLTAYKKVLGITSKLLDVLQKESLDYGGAANLIEASIATFESMRSDSHWNSLWQESVAFANHHGIEISQPRSRQRRTPAAMESYVLTTETVGNNTISELSSESYKVHVYFATIDVIFTEMKERFSNSNISLLKSVGSLNPKSENFLLLSCLSPILSHYSDILPPGNLESEISVLKNYLARNPTTEDNEILHYLLEHIDPVKEAFQVLRQCLLIAMTLGTSTATVERSFSSLHRLKTYLCSMMSQQRLDDLAILYIERDHSSLLWQSINNLVLKFAQTYKNAKITLL